MVRKIFNFSIYATLTILLYVSSIVVAVDMYEHISKVYIPRVTPAHAFLQGPFEPTPTPSLEYTPIFYPSSLSPSYPTPNPTAGIPPCNKKKCN